jgi:hypothetical protein
MCSSNTFLPSFHLCLHTHTRAHTHSLTHSEALPFFLLLIDLSKASALAKFAFKSRTKVNKLRSLASYIGLDAFLGHAAHPTNPLFSWGRAAVDRDHEFASAHEYLFWALLLNLDIVFLRQPHGLIYILNFSILLRVKLRFPMLYTCVCGMNIVLYRFLLCTLYRRRYMLT